MRPQLLARLVCCAALASARISGPPATRSLPGPAVRRGGATTPYGDVKLAAKTAVGVGIETILLCAAIEASRLAPDSVSRLVVRAKILPTKNVLGLPALQVVAWFFVIFASSVVGSLGDRGISSAQLANPNQPPDMEWYKSLNRPSWEPPGIVFPIMWLLISKPTQLLAVARISAAGPNWPALALYCAHLSLGDAWNRVFFGEKRIRLSTLVISTFYTALLATAGVFAKIDVKAGLLMLPTCAWVAVASALNFAVRRLNPNRDDEP
ncbi:TspO/MBR family-domain-containing protein [Pelagophyceae sp. CCMP2097]|nr:TspO/MBR family-domain-containing protein [Pelagophyceae sp. CCMP2097]